MNSDTNFSGLVQAFFTDRVCKLPVFRQIISTISALTAMPNIP